MPAASGFTLITAANIYGNLLGQKLASGQIQFTAISTSTGSKISFEVGGSGGGQMVNKPFSFPIVAGAIVADSSGIAPQLPDVSLTNPVNIGYAVQIIDPLTGDSILGPGYVIQPSGPTFDFDSYTPALGTMVTLQTGPTGPPGGDGAAGGEFLNTLTFTAAGTQNVSHGLNTSSPGISAMVTPGATRYWASTIDVNTTQITTGGPCVMVTRFAGGTSSGSTPIAPAITLQPVSQHVGVGSLAVFTAAASGSPTPTVQWQTDTGTGGVTWTNVGGATSSTYSHTVLTGDNGYRYRAIYTNASGTATTSVASLSTVVSPANSWAMNEGSGNTFVDSVGGANMTLTGALSWGHWVSSAASVLFQGGCAHSSSTLSSVLAGHSPWSIEGWVTIATLPGLEVFMGNASDPAANVPGVGLYFASGSSSIAATIGGVSGGRITVNTAEVIVINTRRLMAITYDGTGTAAGVNIYLDNTLCTMSTITDTLGSSEAITPVGPFTVGADIGGNRAVSSVFENLDVYSYARTIAQIQARFATGV